MCKVEIENFKKRLDETERKQLENITKLHEEMERVCAFLSLNYIGVWVSVSGPG